MAGKFFLLVVKDILINPAKTWDLIDSENRSVSVISYHFLFPLILLVSVSAFAGSLIYINPELSFVYSVLAGIKCFILFYITVYGTSFILKEITFPLELGRNFTVSFRLVSYSMAPLLLCQVLSRFFESMQFVNVLALFGLYIFWTGAERILTPAASKKIPLLVAGFITFVGIFFASNFLLTKLINKIYYAFFS
jgi:hypothetical protein